MILVSSWPGHPAFDLRKGEAGRWGEGSGGAANIECQLTSPQ
jgi:hypothetical protein